MRKSICLLLIFVFGFLFCGEVSAASSKTDFFVGDKYTIEGNLCQSDSDTVTVTKDGSNCVIEYIKIGTYTVQLTSATESSSGLVPGNEISGEIFDTKYKITPQQLVDYINKGDGQFLLTISQLMMLEDYKPEAATKYTYSALLNTDGSITYRFGYDTDQVETTLHIDNNLIDFNITHVTSGTTPAPATEYTSTRYTVGLTSLFFFMMEISPDSDLIFDILGDDKKYDLIDEDIDTIYDKYLYTHSDVTDSENYSFHMRLTLNGKVNADVIELYNSKVQFPDSGANGAEPAPEEEIVNPETGLFVSIMIIAFMGLVSMIIMKINRNRIYRI